MKKETTYYNRQILKSKDSVKRPNEVLEFKDEKGNLELIFKSPKCQEQKITLTKNALLTSSKIQKNNIEIIPTQSNIILDVLNIDTIKININQNINIDDIINLENGKKYFLFIKQDEIGGYNLTFNESINLLPVNDSKVKINTLANTVSILEIDIINDILLIKSNYEYSESEYKDYSNSMIFTIDTTLGVYGYAPTYTLPLKQNYESLTTNTQYIFNYDLLVDWGDGTTSQITTNNIGGADELKTHTYSEHGTYQITLSGLCEGFGNLAVDLNDIFNSLTSFSPTMITNMTFEKIISVENLSYIGIKDASFMFGFPEAEFNLLSIEQSTDDWCKDVTDMSGMFYNCTSLTSLDVSNWDVSNVTSMSGMFSNCASLTNLYISNWNVGSVTNMSGMFSNCASLTNLYISNWNVGSVTNMSGMFYNCTSLTSLDVSNWNVGSVTNMSGMFYNCTSLTSLDVSNWDVSNVIYMVSMFLDTTLDTTSYDNLLVGWSTLSEGETKIPTDVEFDGGNSQYTSVGEAAKNILEGTYNWTITDQGLQV